LVIGILILLSLVLVTASKRSHIFDGAQNTVASLLRPFEVATQRVTHPFRDAAAWMGGLTDARSENERLKAQNAALSRRLVTAQDALNQELAFGSHVTFSGAPTLTSFTRIGALVLVPLQNFADQSVVISAGSNAHIHSNDVVVSPSGDLVGTVSAVYAHESRVRLITDSRSAVTATDVNHPSALGRVTSGASSGSLTFDRVGTAQTVRIGDVIITAGSFGHGDLPSIYPRGLTIGLVDGAINDDAAPFKQISVRPFAALGSLWRVVVLVPKSR
jgi:rod shape-determining protein MreC